MGEDGVSRRALLAGAGFGVLGLSGVVQAIQTATAAAQQLVLPEPLDDLLDVRDTMAAFCDTIVPGPAGGASDTPGALDAGVLEEIYDPFYGVSAAYPLIHADLQLHTPLVLGRVATFTLDLPYADRERVLDNRITELTGGGSNPYATLYQALGVLVYLSYYGTPRSTVGPETIGFPPFSDGYYPGHSYRVRFDGLTDDGNPS